MIFQILLLFFSFLGMCSNKKITLASKLQDRQKCDLDRDKYSLVPKIMGTTHSFYPLSKYLHMPGIILK